MKEFDLLRETVAALRAENGCPWDREQTHASLKSCCVEEAAEVIGGINILEETGKAENLKEELGDLLFQVMLQTQIAEEEGLFTMEEVLDGIRTKMVARHPHVFGEGKVAGSGEVPGLWDSLKKKEKLGREWEKEYAIPALEESAVLLEKAIEKEKRKNKNQ